MEKEKTDEQEYPQRRRRGDVGVPDWAKLAATTASVTIAIILWAISTFISRAEMAQHLDQQAKDFYRVAAAQEHYSDAERGTSANLSEINSRLTRIETLLDPRTKK